MGFGTDLQQKESHEALVRLQDAEIRLLENVRRCFTLRIKSDKEYASALSSVCACAQKFENSEFSSPIFDAWNIIITETQTLSNLLRTRADDLAVNPMEKLVLVISEKKLARKLYYDERNRLDFEIYRLREEVNRNRVEYERMMERLRLDRTRYEELLIKGKSGNKFEEAKSRYLKTTCKLHKLHNEYVLSVRDSCIQQRMMLDTILPNLLDYHHKIQESLVKQCKEVLVEYVRLTDLSYIDIIEAHKNMAKILSSIQPSAEYHTFLQAYKTEPLDDECVEFDDELLDDYRGTLKPDQIAFNDLTIEHINHSRTAYENKILSCKSRIETKENDLTRAEDEMAKLPSDSEMSDEQKAQLLIKQRQSLILKREISELDCHQKKYEALYKMVNTPIEDLGENDPPIGLQLEEAPAEIVNRLETQSLNEGMGSSTFKRKFHNMKNPFAKRSTSAPPKPPSRDVLEKRESMRYENNEDDGDKVVTSKDKSNPNRKIEDEDWFHGVLPREEVQRLLCNDGDFLVRESRNRTSGEPQSVLSVMWKGHKHFIIQGGEVRKEGNWRFEGPSFSTIQELIDHQVNGVTPVTSRSGAILKNMIVRKDWQLCNDSIQLGPRIGKGNFGDVFKGTYRKLEVAVKTCREVLGEDVRKKFLKEGQILRQYDHPNIVKFIGIAAQRQPIMIVMEYVPGGSLLNFLKEKGSKQSTTQLISMCVDAAAGMGYLESHNCIHRDLAARNCLVGDQNIVKIADFGMSREEEVYVISEGCKQIPIKWTAPEALELAKYTSKCDVWSFGVLMWEVFAFGETPYKGMNNNQAKTQILKGYRMAASTGTPDEVYQMMLRCWNELDTERPNFELLHDQLEQISARS